MDERWGVRDEWDWGHILEGHLAAICKVALRHGLQPADAEDACQTAACKALEAGPSTIRNLPGWLYRVAVNAVLDQSRRNNRLRDRFVPLQPQILVPSRDALPHLSIVDKDDRRQLQQCLSRLRPEERAILKLRYFRELSLRQVALRLQTPLRTVERRLAQARSHLKKSWIRCRPGGNPGRSASARGGVRGDRLT